jgi:hypothetical protein
MVSLKDGRINTFLDKCVESQQEEKLQVTGLPFGSRESMRVGRRKTFPYFKEIPCKEIFRNGLAINLDPLTDTLQVGGSI